MSPSAIQIIGAVLFGLAVIHTFSTRYFERLAHKHTKHAGLWHLLGEVEVVFGFWAMVLVICIFALDGKQVGSEYLESRNLTEPMFVFAIMVIAGSKPILQLARNAVSTLASLLPVPVGQSTYFLSLSLLPLLGSFITEPAAMTVAALILRDHYFARGLSSKCTYATLGVLFVNVSIGGVLTPYAAPPVLMVAGKWGWTLGFMLNTFGWKAVIAVVINALGATLIFRRELGRLEAQSALGMERMSATVTAVHVFTLTAAVVFAHDATVFMGLFLFFLGFTAAYPRYQSALMLRQGLLVAFFLAGLVVLGGRQNWWLQPLIERMSEGAVYLGATVLTAFLDNAALTYLGSLVDGLTPEFKYSLVAGAVTGGGLTVIANAPNPAGYSILRSHFRDGAISALWLAVAALGPTMVALAAFRLL